MFRGAPRHPARPGVHLEAARSWKGREGRYPLWHGQEVRVAREPAGPGVHLEAARSGGAEMVAWHTPEPRCAICHAGHCGAAEATPGDVVVLQAASRASGSRGPAAAEDSRPTWPGLDLEAPRSWKGQEVRVPPLKGARGPGPSRAHAAGRPAGPGVHLEAARSWKGQEVRVPPLKGPRGPGRSRASAAWPGPGGRPAL